VQHLIYWQGQRVCDALFSMHFPKRLQLVVLLTLAQLISQFKFFNYIQSINFLFNFMVSKTLAICFLFFGNSF
jgi:hypothetical protein